jgi:hypothetical protein
MTLSILFTLIPHLDGKVKIKSKQIAPSGEHAFTDPVHTGK